MNTQSLLEAVNQICLNRGIDPKDVFDALREALQEAYKQEHPKADVHVDVNDKAGEIHIYVRKTVVETVKNPDTEISKQNAQNYVKDIKTGAVLEIEIPIGSLGRIAANATKRVLNKILRDAELKAIADYYTQHIDEITSGKILFVRPDKIIVELEKGNAEFPEQEQIPDEFYDLGKRYKFLVKEVLNEKYNRKIILSRRDPKFIIALFKLEVPELRKGQVDIVAIAREAGIRTKVAVKSLDTSLDPIGTLVGPKGMRISSVMQELPNESIDVIKWDASPSTFIANALSPAKVSNVKIQDKGKKAIVEVSEDQYEIALGKNGINVKLAEEVTGYTIDIKKTK